LNGEEASQEKEQGHAFTSTHEGGKDAGGKEITLILEQIKPINDDRGGEEKGTLDRSNVLERVEERLLYAYAPGLGGGRLKRGIARNDSGGSDFAIIRFSRGRRGTTGLLKGETNSGA